MAFISVNECRRSIYEKWEEKQRIYGSAAKEQEIEQKRSSSSLVSRAAVFLTTHKNCFRRNKIIDESVMCDEKVQRQVHLDFLCSTTTDLPKKVAIHDYFLRKTVTFLATAVYHIVVCVCIRVIWD